MLSKMALQPEASSETQRPVPNRPLQNPVVPRLLVIAPADSFALMPYQTSGAIEMGSPSAPSVRPTWNDESRASLPGGRFGPTEMPTSVPVSPAASIPAPPPPPPPSPFRAVFSPFSPLDSSPPPSPPSAALSSPPHGFATSAHGSLSS